MHLPHTSHQSSPAIIPRVSEPHTSHQSSPTIIPRVIEPHTISHHSPIDIVTLPSSPSRTARSSSMPSSVSSTSSSQCGSTTLITASPSSSSTHHSSQPSCAPPPTTSSETSNATSSARSPPIESTFRTHFASSGIHILAQTSHTALHSCYAYCHKLQPLAEYLASAIADVCNILTIYGLVCTKPCNFCRHRYLSGQAYRPYDCDTQTIVFNSFRTK